MQLIKGWSLPAFRDVDLKEETLSSHTASMVSFVALHARLPTHRHHHSKQKHA